MKRAVIALSCIRLVPHLILFVIAPNRATMAADLKRWYRDEPEDYDGRPELWAFAEAMTRKPEYRSLFYYRVKRVLAGLVDALRGRCAGRWRRCT